MLVPVDLRLVDLLKDVLESTVVLFQDGAVDRDVSVSYAPLDQRCIYQQLTSWSTCTVSQKSIR